MCKTPLHDFLKRLPKAEHHLHLEGALSPTLLFELAKRNNISLPTEDSAFNSPDSLQSRYGRFTSLDDFLHYYYFGMSVLIHAHDFEALAWDYFQHASADGVHHAEVFFDPQAHTTRGVSYNTVLSGFESACRRAERELGITTELITCFLRHLPVEDCLATFENEHVQQSYRSGAVKGIGLDSSEVGFPPHLFSEIYEKARKQGLRRTAHAGGEGPVDFIASALDTLGIERIDHGIRLADDADLMAKVAAQGTLLTTCPISNVVLGSVPSIQDLPIRKFLDAGVRFSINSDDPAYFGRYILDNYCSVQESFDLDVQEWGSISRAGIEGSWCGDGRKREILTALEELMKEWQEL
ncbi:adenosine deaminase [Lindgomyces ingoldianus]|uniref:Adenosine deaminase n=1 Tax=Lindgomyces ingoldianus TaxID=673940 RepID=A0ACB6QUG8_9PLEO|nr:adenosine deaminase [Lindgomyces ingoldianus]KAF2469732.1 adenosine deaminase [Lindgomyces ingoldianus]